MFEQPSGFFSYGDNQCEHKSIDASQWPIEPQFSQVCNFFAYVGLHQVRILVFDNYQVPAMEVYYRPYFVIYREQEHNKE